jgi:site-specific recombinase XerD
LPPEITKGGKKTGESQTIFAGTPRFCQLLEARRFALKNKPTSRTFIFGTEEGRYQKGFRRMWRELFTLAKLDWGRDKGLVWHTTRHGFISRVAEDTKDPVLTQEVARHRNLETTQGYFHARRDRRYAAVAGLGRAVKS